MTNAVCSITAGALAFACGEAHAASANSQWAALASAATVSPFVAGKGDTASQWVAPDGRRITLTIRGPHPSGNGVVTVPLPAPSADATPVLAAAISNARTSGAATISLTPGTYTFRSLDTSGIAQLVIAGLHDVTIRGNGAVFVFMQNADGVYVTECQRLVIQSLRVAYGFNTVSLGTIVSRGNGNALVVTHSQYPITAADGIGALEQVNPTTHAFVPGGTRIYQPVSPTLVAGDTYTSPSFNASSLVGEDFAVLHHYYGGNAIEIEDSFLSGANQDQDITLNNIDVWSGPGMGMIAYGVKRGLFILNSAVTPKPGAMFSTEYDGMHLQQIGGDVYIENNTIGGQGDDAINAASPVSPVVGTNAAATALTLGVYSRFIQTGDTLAFFDDGDDFLGATTVQSVTSTGYPNSSFVLASPVRDVGSARWVRDVSLTNDRMIIARNTIGNCECHAILLQTPDAMVLDNNIDGTADGGIEALSNIGVFQEGTGAINDIIEGNVLNGTGNDASLPMPWGAISLYGAISAGVETSPINFNDVVRNNSIAGVVGEGCMTVASSDGVVATGNTCTNTNLDQPAHTPSISVLDAANVSVSGNTMSGPTTGPIAVAGTATGVTQ